MKHIRLSQVDSKTRAGCYNIYLGNGTAHVFKNRKAADKFLADTSRFLTHKLYELRGLCKDVRGKYDDYWGYFLHDKQTMSAELAKKDRACKENFRQADELFDTMVWRCGHTNGNYFVFRHFDAVARLLKENILILSALSKSKSLTSDRFIFDSMFNRIQAMETELKNYGQLESSALFILPEHITEQVTFIPSLTLVA